MQCLMGGGEGGEGVEKGNKEKELVEREGGKREGRGGSGKK